MADYNLERILNNPKELEYHRNKVEIHKRHFKALDKMLLGLGEFSGSFVLSVGFGAAPALPYHLFLPLYWMLTLDGFRRVLDAYSEIRDIKAVECLLEEKHGREKFY